MLAGFLLPLSIFLSLFARFYKLISMLAKAGTHCKVEAEIPHFIRRGALLSILPPRFGSQLCPFAPCRYLGGSLHLLGSQFVMHILARI